LGQFISRAIVNFYMMIPFAGCLPQAGPDKRLPIIETFITPPGAPLLGGLLSGHEGVGSYN